MADFADRSLGIGYVGGSLILLAILITVLGLWRFSVGSVAVDHIVSRKAEMFYWAAILFSNTLGTALGDLLTKPFAHGGLNLDRISSSLVIAIFMAGCILFTSRKAGSHPGSDRQSNSL